jgi:hypothetical protein
MNNTKNDNTPQTVAAFMRSQGIQAMSVAQYAEHACMSVQAVRDQIKDGRLPAGVEAQFIGSYYAIFVRTK